MDHLFDTKSVNLLCGEISRRMKPGNHFKTANTNYSTNNEHQRSHEKHRTKRYEAQGIH